MDILNIQSLVANGLITDVASIDPNKAYIAVGIYQPGNRPAGSGNNTYPSYAIPVAEFLASGGIYTASNGITLVGNDFQLASNLISQFTNDSNYISGTGTLGKIPFWFPNGTTLGDSPLYTNGTQVGLNNNNPTAMFDILASGSGTVGLNLGTTSTQDAIISLSTNNALTARAKVYLENSSQTLNFYTVNNDTIFWNGNGLAQVKTLTLFTDTTAKFETKLGIGVSSGTTSLNVQGDALNPLFKLNNANFLFADKLRVNNNGDFYSGSINAFGGFGTADFVTDHLNYTFNTSYQTYLAFTNAQGAGNKAGYGIIGSSIINADSDYKLVVLNNDAGTLGSVVKVLSTSANNANDAFDYTNYGINVISNGIVTNAGAGTFYKAGINLDITNGDVNRAINVENGIIRVVKANQPLYATLTSGDFYYDTAANILANGDFVVGMKA